MTPIDTILAAPMKDGATRLEHMEAVLAALLQDKAVGIMLVFMRDEQGLTCRQLYPAVAQGELVQLLRGVADMVEEGNAFTKEVRGRVQ